ncbi:hypothetical protein [Poseidonibacter lekithochrous]|uniref:hypothetical protein n=1 Tax=Poseidonibacter lekithochrous TaxID=1904463 RepID=UPI0008FC8C1D|nr:hypothetical protein [Poseidonibacter lekithochrous]QKJ23820.1 hypothetical protein ALEK_2575 [Poseidonibacter lekithochrous]
MGELEKLFDKYSFNARVKPAFFLVFPIVMSIFVWLEDSRTWGGASLTFIISFGIISFASSQMSTKGNILQERLFSKWGGAATTIIFRHSDDRLDKYTKERYMKKLEILIPNFISVSLEKERDEPADTDEMYRSASSYLREKTRDISVYPLVFKENISYGFSRNLRAFKSVGIFICILSLTINFYLIWNNYFKGLDKSFSESFTTIPFEYIGLIMALICMLIFWIFAITEKWVEIRAFAYARALLASCETT